MHYLIKKSFQGLYPEKDLNINANLKYSRAFKGYNANVKYSERQMEFRLSNNWREVSDEIKIGLLQHLLNKVYNTNISTMNMDLYNIFLKKVPSVTPRTKSDPVLEDSFNRMNEEYFDGMLEMPNLEFAGKNFHTLGTYDFGTDTIRISALLLKNTALMDFVMYHEMIHKHLKYQSRGNRTIHHSREFRSWEKKYKVPDIEKKLRNFLKTEKYLNWMQKF